MLVSAVITTHKRSPEIVERAIKSIVTQTHKEIEVIVVDDSPSDFDMRADVKAMVESYSANNVRYIAHEKCMGACAARNTGLEAANGEFIGYLDDDDEWLPEKIEEQLKGFTSDDIALVYCGHQVIRDETGETTERKPTIVLNSVYEKLLHNNFIGSTSFPLIKTSALREIGGFDILMQSAQDYDVWLRIAEKYSVNCIDKPLVRYHFHAGEQITKNPQKKIAGLERILEKNIVGLKKDRLAYWKSQMVLVPWYAKAGRRKKAFAVWFKAAFKKPFKLVDNARFLYSIFKTN